MKFLLLAIFCLTLLSCVGMPRKFYNIDHCAKNDLKCIDISLDENRNNKNMYTFMEGYSAASLVELKALGRLTVHEINLLLPISSIVFIGPLAYTKIWPAKYGDIYKAEIYFPSWAPNSNQLYAHEAMHAQGTWGNWLHGPPGDYTDKQKEIMKEEGVIFWVETYHYKSEDPIYHVKSE